MNLFHRAVHLLLRFLIFLVPITALLVLGFAAFSFISTQLADTPQPPQVALVRPASEQGIDLSPATIELRLIGLYLRMQQQVIDTPAGADATLRPFKIALGEPAVTVAGRLQEQGLITDAAIFRLYMRVNGVDKRLAAGDFELAPNMTMTEIAERLQKSRIREISVTIPEGMRAE